MRSVTVQYLEDYSYTQLLTAEGHAFVADEPPEGGGDVLGPDPYEILLWSLGACTAMTVLLYARRKGHPVDGIAVQVEHDRVYAADCEECVQADGDAAAKVEVIRRKISVRGNISDEVRDDLLRIAQRCPVHKTLQAAPQVIDTITVGP